MEMLDEGTKAAIFGDDRILPVGCARYLVGARRDIWLMTRYDIDDRSQTPPIYR